MFWVRVRILGEVKPREFRIESKLTAVVLVGSMGGGALGKGLSLRREKLQIFRSVFVIPVRGTPSVPGERGGSESVHEWAV